MMVSDRKKKLDVNARYDFEPGSSVTAYVRKLLKKKGLDQQRKRWLRTFDTCVLSEDVKRAIDDAITMVLMAHKFEEWGVNDHYEKGLTNSILLYGEPGTGKTMITESIAAVLGLNLMMVGSADLQSSVPGKTERNIREIFEKASETDSMILFDECDSVLADRNSVGAIMGAEINALLTEIERFEGVVCFTTNRLHRLDRALQRRIVSKIHVKNPDNKTRKLIWKNLIPKKMPLDDKVDFGILAEAELNGGDIKNCVLMAARSAVAENSDKVLLRHFLYAIEQVIRAKKDYEETRPKKVKYLEKF